MIIVICVQQYNPAQSMQQHNISYPQGAKNQSAVIKVKEFITEPSGTLCIG